MPVFRTEKTSDYAVIAKHHLKNRTLSYKAKGLLTFMLSVPDNWDYSLAGLAVLSSDGVDSIRSGINELEKHGYVTRRRIRDDNGRLGETEYTIHEIPRKSQNGVSDDLPKKLPTQQDIPELEKPMLDFPTLDKPILESPTQLSNNVLSNKELSNKKLNNEKIKHTCQYENTLGSIESRQLYPGTSIDQVKQFEQFWQAYPRKVSKKAAREAWEKLEPDEILFSAIISAVNVAERYWSHYGISQRHIPYPSTWLSEERWDDELSFAQSSRYVNKVHGKELGRSARIPDSGVNYTIGGSDDPYHAVMYEN